MNIKNFLRSVRPNILKTKSNPVYRSYIHRSKSHHKDISSNYRSIASTAFMGNIIAHRAIGMIARNASNVTFLLYKQDGSKQTEIYDHTALSILQRPSKNISGVQFLETLFTHQMISGNAYIHIVKNQNRIPIGMELLRPDRIKIVSDSDGTKYIYNIGNDSYCFNMNDDGLSDILHLKNFHPLDDWYGLSSLEVALDSIDQHNKCISWNKSLLENGARPSGALMVKSGNHNSGYISDEQFDRLKSQINEQLSGEDNAGRVMILEGGLEWQDISINPKDMDFIETKNGAARDIALALGIPPQMLGIKGDNTYNNMSEARVAFWEETVLPLLGKFCSSLSHWLSFHFDEELIFTHDIDNISALNVKRQTLWDNLKNSDFITNEEKRQMLGF